MRIQLFLLALTTGFIIPASGADDLARFGTLLRGAVSTGLLICISISTALLSTSRGRQIMDAVGLGIAVNLSGGYVTRSTLPCLPIRTQQATGRPAVSGRFLQYMNLDYSGWDAPEFSERAVKQIEEGHRLGAAVSGVQEAWTLSSRRRGKLIRIDDPKLDPVWERCGELNMRYPFTSPTEVILAPLQREERALAGIEGPSKLVVWRHQ